MHKVISEVNWEHVGMILFSIASALGVTFGWLKKMCSKIESTNLDVAGHKEEIQKLMEEFRQVSEVMKEYTRKE